VSVDREDKHYYRFLHHQFIATMSASSASATGDVTISVDAPAPAGRATSGSGADETTPLSPHRLSPSLSSGGTMNETPLPPSAAASSQTSREKELEAKIAAKLTPEEMAAFTAMSK
jgi:hypothetical protein